MNQQLKRILGVVVLLTAPPATTAPGQSHPASDADPESLPTHGQFWREFWYERVSAGHPPTYTRRLRINAPETSLGEFAHRPEARENGLMLITAEQDLLQLAAAELYAELWGGHPHSGEKRVTVNGRSTYVLPDPGTRDGHCTYTYPTVPLALTDLVNGTNAFQWAIDLGDTFWGHAMVDNACLRVALKPDHPDLAAAGLGEFEATVVPTGLDDLSGRTIVLELACSEPAAVGSIQFEAWHDGYDENGDGRTTDWHTYSLKRERQGAVAACSAPPFRAAWDASMLPHHKDVWVRAVVRLKDHPNLYYLTPPARAPSTGPRTDHGVMFVRILTPDELPKPFWSRDGNKKVCHIEVPADPSLSILHAVLHVNTWTGGAGEVRDYFTLNGHAYPVAEGSAHEVQTNHIEIDPARLARGKNTIELLSDTHHHGIEILYPGPALAVLFHYVP